jgi:hypothetical protein
MKQKFTGVLHTKPLPEVPKSPNRFRAMLQGKNVTSATEQARGERAYRIAVEMARSAQKKFWYFKNELFRRFPNQFKDIANREDKYNEHPAVWNEERLAKEAKELRETIKQYQLPVAAADPLAIKLRELKLLFAANDADELSAAIAILEHDGWTCDKATNWTTKYAPGYILTIENTSFTIRKGQTVLANKEPLYRLYDILKEAKLTGEIPGSVTNSIANI